MKKRIPIDEIKKAPELVLTEIDRLGGNGRWRERKAISFFEQKAVEDQERLQEQRAMEEKRRQRKLQLEAKRRRQKEEEEAKQRAHEEQRRKEQEHREQQLALAREKERQAREAEEREWQARQPRICEACMGTGQCSNCGGTGVTSAVFLAGYAPKNESMLGFGRMVQGCEDCGGCRQNILGCLQKGTGRCSECNGRGKVWPEAAFKDKAHHGRRLNRVGTLTKFELGPGIDLSPKSAVSMTSPKAQAGMLTFA